MENYQKRLKNAVINLRRCNDIIEVNIQYIYDFLNQLSAENLSTRRKLKYVYILKKLFNYRIKE